MSPLLEAAVEVQEFFRRKRWRFCIIGGLAVIRWGQPRVTQDVDVSLLTGFGNEPKYVDRLLNEFAGRISDARQFALEHRVLLCQATNGVALDISLAALPLEEQIIRRSSRFAYAPKVSLRTASAEDLVVLKAFADRDKDWPDVRGILVRQENRLDWDQIIRDLTFLCDLKEDQEPLERLERVRQESKERRR